MSENNKKYILITAALIVIGAALYFFYWMRTPQYTFTQIHEAVQQHDLTKFEKHVDLKSIMPLVIPKRPIHFYSVSFKA